ncbi:MAG: hypothetical protein QXG97_06855 [Nitrososphaerota archaeon]
MHEVLSETARYAELVAIGGSATIWRNAELRRHIERFMYSWDTVRRLLPQDGVKSAPDGLDGLIFFWLPDDLAGSYLLERVSRKDVPRVVYDLHKRLFTTLPPVDEDMVVLYALAEEA